MKRRDFLAGWVFLAAARAVFGREDLGASHWGICTFSCHRHWEAVRRGDIVTQFRDPVSFWEYARKLGAAGVQTSLRDTADDALPALRHQIAELKSYWEGDLTLPQSADELVAFEREVQRHRQIGVTVARSVLSSRRRYEAWRTAEEVAEFRRAAEVRLRLVIPILERYELRLAVENHKDLTSDELVELLEKISSPWLGVTLDTGNNLALLEDPYETVEALAPYVLTVHLKDMAVQPYEEGLLLSEVPCGRGLLDLPRLVRRLRQANPLVNFNLEMATRDPLRIPYCSDAYWGTFTGDREQRTEWARSLVETHPLRQPVPLVTGVPWPEQLVREEANNRDSFAWLQSQFASR